LIRSVQQFNPTLTVFDCSVFTGEYVTGDIDEKYLAWVEENRAENTSTRPPAEEAMLKREVQVGCTGPMNGADDIVGLHNTFKVGSP